MPTPVRPRSLPARHPVITNSVMPSPCCFNAAPTSFCAPSIHGEVNATPLPFPFSIHAETRALCSVRTVTSPPVNRARARLATVSSTSLTPPLRLSRTQPRGAGPPLSFWTESAAEECVTGEFPPVALELDSVGERLPYSHGLLRVQIWSPEKARPPSR
jgi:hypothetical protein